MDSGQRIVIPATAGLALAATLPASRREAVLAMYAQKLQIVLAYDDSAAFSKSCREFLKQYIGDLARERLSQLQRDEESVRVTGAAAMLRKSTFQALRRLALIPGGVDVELLVDGAVVFETGNHSAMVDLTSDALNSTPALLGDLKSQVLPAFSLALTPESMPIESLMKTGYCLSRILNCGPAIAETLAQRDFVVGLSRAYQSKRASTSSETLLAKAKAYLVDAFHAIIQHKLSRIRADPSASAYLFEVLFALFDQPAPSSSHSSTSSTHYQLLLQTSLVSAYETTYHLSDTIAAIDTMDNGMRDYVVETLKEQRLPGIHTAPEAGSRPDAPVNGHSKAADPKGKSRAEPEQDATSLELAISQVLDILPDENPAFVRACLQHPQFDMSVEKVIAALLEDKLPSDLAKKHGAGDMEDNQRSVEDAQFPLLQSRRNVFDDADLDFSKLRIGKNRSENADAIIQDRSYIEAVKADILRRVLAQDEEDEELANEAEGGRVVAFDEELEDGVELESVKVAGDGDETEEVDGEDIEEEQQQQQPPLNLDSLLEQTYLRDAKVFDRDAATRRSKQRADLRTQTGWTDEQLEGWRIMLERNPRKDKILERHTQPQNTPLNQHPVSQPSASTTNREAVPTRGGRGGRGGRGQGRGGSGGDARERAWKDKNKARQGNHDRKRGHDKKMARGGGPAV